MCCPVGDRSFRSTRIEELRKLSKQFPGVRRFQYNGYIQELRPDDEIGDADGDNNEPLAFNTLKKAGITHCVMITDGGADDPPKALLAAIGLKIDVFYVGPDPVPKFLRDLAKQTGGEYGSASLSAIKELGQAITQRLGLPAPVGKKGPIAL